VFAGFLNAIALILVISQGKQILILLTGSFREAWPSLVIAAICFAVAYAARSLNPKLPAGVLGLVAAAVGAVILTRLGYALPPVLSADTQWVVPTALLDFRVLDHANGALGAVLLHTAVAGALLGVVVFLNTITVAETVSQVDDKPLPNTRQVMLLSAGKIISACLGSVPMSASPSPSLAAMRTGGLTSGSLIMFSLLALLFYSLDLLAWIPSAAIIGLLLFVALILVDQASVRLAWSYVLQPRARQATSAMQREDLLIVVLVTALGAMANMVAALLAGMVLGLVLFAKRNGKSPIKDLHDGRAWRSNCARSASDTALLIQHGERILSVRLQGALYFGVARSLRTEIEALLPQRTQPQWLILDWRAVVSHDTTLALMLDRFEKSVALLGVSVFHCARPGHGGGFADLDRALEVCENQLLDEQRLRTDAFDSDVSHLNALLVDLDPTAQSLLKGCFERRDYAAGEHVLRFGEKTRDLHVIASGRADVLIQGGTIRLAGVNAGAIVGEMGFLDASPRAADVVAVEPLVSLALSRESFDALSQQHPEVAQQILQILCTELANRLRFLHQLISRERA
jgi:SulP family sulfate permease